MSPMMSYFLVSLFFITLEGYLKLNDLKCIQIHNICLHSHMYDSLFSRSGLSLERMKNFLMVVESGSIAKAAGRDLNRQSLFSRQIRELEEFFRVELTSRKGKGIEITPAGHRLGVLIRSHLTSLEDFVAEANAEPRIISIGGGGSAMSWIIDPVAGKLSDVMEGAALRLETLKSMELIEKIRDGRLDFAVVRKSAVPKNLPALKIVEVGYLLCLPQPMLVKGTSVPEILKTCPLALPAGGCFKQILQDVFTSMDVPWKPAVESHSFVQALSLVRTGQYVSILPSTGALQLSKKDFVLKRVPQLNEYRREVVLHWNERQMTTRNIDLSMIRSMGRILNVKS